VYFLGPGNCVDNPAWLGLGLELESSGRMRRRVIVRLGSDGSVEVEWEATGRGVGRGWRQGVGLKLDIVIDLDECSGTRFVPVSGPVSMSVAGGLELTWSKPSGDVGQVGPGAETRRSLS
jgi:hypothetical protein